MILINKKYRFNNIFESRKNNPIMHEVAKMNKTYYKNIMEKCDNKIPLTLKEFVDICKCYDIQYNIIIIKNRTYFKRVSNNTENIIKTINDILNDFLELDIGKIDVEDFEFEEIYNVSKNHNIKIKIK